MKPIEKRLRALEALAQIKPLQPVPRIIVGVGETVADVLAREGVVPVEGQRIGLIARQIVAPKPIEGVVLENEPIEDNATKSTT